MERIYEVFKKAKEFNELKNEYYACVEYSGHIELINITIRKRVSHDQIMRLETYLDAPELIGTLDEIIEKFMNQIKELSITDQSTDSSND